MNRLQNFRFFSTVLLSVVVSLFFRCGVSSEALQSAIESCENQTYEEVSLQNDISEDCRKAVISLLPKVTDELEKRIHLLAQSNEGSNEVLFLGRSEELSEVEVYNSSGELLDESSYQVESVSSLDSKVFGLSFVTDYSGSMRDEDILLSSELFIDIATNLKDLSSYSSYNFSDQVFVKQQNTTELEEIVKALGFDQKIERGSTSLYDGFKAGYEDLQSRDLPVKVLIVSTDGMENSSTATKKEIKDLIDTNTFVIVIGSLFADLSEMKVMTEANGAVLYAPTLKAVKTRALKIKSVLANSLRITLLAPKEGTYRVQSGEESLEVNVE